MTAPPRAADPGPPEAPAPARHAGRRAALVLVALAALASAAFARPDPPAASTPCGAFAPPAPALLRALAFGHERALARLLWSRARVAHGACFARGQRFEGAAAYVDAVRALDPSFREPYRYVEAFVAGPGRPSPDALAFARRVLAEGARRFPDDAELVERAAAAGRSPPLAASRRPRRPPRGAALAPPFVQRRTNDGLRALIHGENARTAARRCG
ncbi:MAG TPA: hypothetical protein VFS00_26320 [Polyangiaceae bacterium]|nr:hypothetical protein [Polyangiaceae bacterium]